MKIIEKLKSILLNWLKPTPEPQNNFDLIAASVADKIGGRLKRETFNFGELLQEQSLRFLAQNLAVKLQNHFKLPIGVLQIKDFLNAELFTPENYQSQDQGEPHEVSEKQREDSAKLKAKLDEELRIDYRPSSLMYQPK